MRVVMIRLLSVLAMVTAAAVAAFGATIVTGIVVDPNSNPYANGTASAYSIAASGQATSYTTPVSTDATGAFSIVVPVNGQYIFTICAPPALHGIPATVNTPQQVCFTSTPITISGATLDVSVQLDAAAVVLGPKSGSGGGGSGINCSGAPSIVIQSVIGQLAICDPQLVPDGNGSLGLVNLNASGNVTAQGTISGNRVATTGNGGILDLQFQTAPTLSDVALNHAATYADTSTGLLGCVKNIANTLLPCFTSLQLLATGPVTMPTSPIASPGCSATVTLTATGATTGSRIVATPTVKPDTVTGYGPSTGGLYIEAWVTTNTANFEVCNPPGGVTVTPGAITLNAAVF